MGDGHEEEQGRQILRCTVCDDVIGIYEPLVHIDDGLPRPTSRAAEPSVTRSKGQCYHLECYERLGGES
jgi:hypothetical protein